MFREDCTGNRLDAERFHFCMFCETLCMETPLIVEFDNVWCRILSMMHGMHVFVKWRWHSELLKDVTTKVSSNLIFGFCRVW